MLEVFTVSRNLTYACELLCGIMQRTNNLGTRTLRFPSF